MFIISFSTFAFRPLIPKWAVTCSTSCPEVVGQALRAIPFIYIGASKTSLIF